MKTEYGASIRRPYEVLSVLGLYTQQNLELHKAKNKSVTKNRKKFRLGDLEKIKYEAWHLTGGQRKINATNCLSMTEGFVF